jgi:hypothetical protein
MGRVAAYGLCVVVMFHLTCYGWLLFRAASLRQVGVMTRSLLQPGWPENWSALAQVLALAAPLLLVQVLQRWSGRLDFLSFPFLPVEARVAAYATLVYFLVFHGGQPQAFIYFQF